MSQKICFMWSYALFGIYDNLAAYVPLCPERQFAIQFVEIFEKPENRFMLIFV